VKTSRILSILGLAGLVAILAFAPGAWAQVDQHSGGDEVLSQEAEVLDAVAAPTPPQAGASSLPVTGGDIAGAIALSSVIVAGGAGMVLIARRRAHA
jgi:hypothetical protein